MRESREALAGVLRGLAKNDAIKGDQLRYVLMEWGEWRLKFNWYRSLLLSVADLDSWDRRKVEEADYEKRHAAYHVVDEVWWEWLHLPHPLSLYLSVLSFIFSSRWRCNCSHRPYSCIRIENSESFFPSPSIPSQSLYRYPTWPFVQLPPIHYKKLSKLSEELWLSWRE